MANIVIPFAAVSHQPVPTVGFNNNFTEVANKFNTFAVQTDVAKVITVAHTWNAAQIMAGLSMTGDILFTDATYDIGKVGATRPRDGFFSRNMTIGGTLAVTGAASTGALTAAVNSSFATNLSITGAAGSDRAMRWQTAGVARWLFYANSAAEAGANAGSTLILGAYDDAGASIDSPWVMVRAAGGLWTVARPTQFNSGLNGNVTLNTGSLIFTAAASKIIPGATSVSHRNNADTADNVLITDIGNMTVRLGITAGGSITAPISATAGSFHATPSASDPAISTSDGDIWILTSGAFKAKLNGSVRTLWHSGQVSTGYAAWTGTLNRASVFDQSTATLANVAQRLAAIQNDLMTAGILST